MPGVPSGRACDACRKQKKKCDEQQPACSRCNRLNINCVGSGQRRFQFKEAKEQQLGESSRRGSPSKDGKAAGQIIKSRSSATLMSVFRVSPVRTPTDPATRLADQLADTMKKSTSIKYNLLWNFGLFMREVPKRLGTNEALDAAVVALLTSHSEFCQGQQVSSGTLSKYSHALVTLRSYLDDPVRARSSETLCAVMLLLLCQTFIGFGGNAEYTQWIGHYLGAAKILKTRRYYNINDPWEVELLLSLRGPVLFGGIFDDRINFTAEEWETLVVSVFDGASNEGQMMCCLAKLPNYMRRGRDLLNGAFDDLLLLEMRANYARMKSATQGLKTDLARAEPLGRQADTEDTNAFIYAYYHRLYTFCLTVSIMVNKVLSAIDNEDAFKLSVESTSFALDILALEEFASKYRPLGGGYMGLGLMISWIATTDTSIRMLVEAALEKYQHDFPKTREFPITHGLIETSDLLNLKKSRLTYNAVMAG